MWQSTMANVIKPYTIHVLCGSWNVNETRPKKGSLWLWLSGKDKADKADLVVVGLQEVEMGTGSVARGVAIDFFSKSTLQVDLGFPAGMSVSPVRAGYGPMCTHWLPVWVTVNQNYGMFFHRQCLS